MVIPLIKIEKDLTVSKEPLLLTTDILNNRIKQ